MHSTAIADPLLHQPSGIPTHVGSRFKDEELSIRTFNSLSVAFCDICHSPIKFTSCPLPVRWRLEYRNQLEEIVFTESMDFNNR